MSVRARVPFLCLLALTCIGFAVFLGVANAPAVGREESQAPQTGEKPKRLSEVVELRDATSKTYALDTGQREWVSKGSVMHYQDTQGAWQEIDNRPVADAKRVDGADFAYRNAANAHTVRMGAKAGVPELVLVEYEGKSVAFGPRGAKGSAGAAGVVPASVALTDMAMSENCVTYFDLFPGVDVVYEANGNGVREHLVLKKSTAQNEFEFDLKMKGVTAREVDGRISFVDAKDDEVFSLGSPLAVDEAREVSGEVTYSLSGQGKRCQLKVTLSREYLEDPGRAFPVVIDPDLEIIKGSTRTFDNYIDTGDPDAVNSYTDPYLRTGYEPSGTFWRRSLIRFDLSNVDIPAAAVDHGIIRLEQCSGPNPAIQGYPCAESWSSQSVTWANAPYFDNNVNSDSATSVNYWDGPGWWWQLFTTKPIKKWLSGEWANYGWTIKDIGEWNTSEAAAAWFYSSDSASVHQPELHIYYSIENVRVKAPCDGRFRSYVGSSWGWTANNAVEQADDAFLATYGIDFNVVATDSWTSPSDGCAYASCSSSHTGLCPHCGYNHGYYHANGYVLMNNAWSKYSSGADLLTCFTGAYVNDPDFGGESAGLAYDYGADRCIVTPHSSNLLWRVTRHEMSHLYWADDHDWEDYWGEGPDCVMYYDMGGYIDCWWQWCDGCKATILSNRTLH